MFRILTCLRDQHDWRLVLLAVLVCGMASLAAVYLLRYARDTTRRRRRWLLCAGAATGFGIWATHFIAILAFDPGIGLAFLPGLTFVSLALAVVLTSSGFWLAIGRRDAVTQSMGGALVSGGIAAMHYVGMAALEIPARLLWSGDLVALSIVGGAAFTIPAVRIAASGRRWPDAALAGLLLMLGISAHHFIAMGAVTVVPVRSGDVDDFILSPTSMAVSITVAAAAILALTVGAAAMRGRAAAALRASQREFHTLVQGITDCAIYMLRPDGSVATWNAGAERLTGYSVAEAIGLPIASFCPDEPGQAERAARALEAARERGKVTGEGWRYRKDGSRFWAHVTIERVLDNAGRLTGFAKITRDMTQAKADADRLVELAANLDIALANMHQGLCLFDRDERLVLANRRVGEMFHLSEDRCPPGTPYRELMRTALSGIIGVDPDEERVEEAYRRHRACIERPEGGILIAELSDDCVVAISHRPLAEGGWVTTYDDITERRRSEERIAHMALHDSLTGLPNRAHFNQRLDIELARAEGSHRVAVIAIDVDRFKEINDSRGHAIGDEVLKRLGARMTAALGEGEFVARFGGDEFAAIKVFDDARELADFVERIERALVGAVDVAEQSIVTAASIGIAISPEDARTREQLLNNADLAMYRAKSSVAARTCYYESRMDEQARIRRTLAADMRAGMERGEFHLAYQIQRSLATGEVVGYEALLRWEHPTRGAISPAEFIPIAEDSGAIIELGEWVLRRACADAAAWSGGHKVAVNLSPLQFAHHDLPGLVRDVLVETGLSPRRLELEITESTLIGDKLRGLHILRQIKALGVTIAIDDFGTGYASLDTLNSFPFDKIKIDRSFLAEALANPQAHAIIRAVLALGRSMGVPVLAEGIETEAQLALLRADGCEEGQGYLFGRPAAVSAIEAARDAA